MLRNASLLVPLSQPCGVDISSPLTLEGCFPIHLIDLPNQGKYGSWIVGDKHVRPGEILQLGDPPRGGIGEGIVSDLKDPLYSGGISR